MAERLARNRPGRLAERAAAGGAARMELLHRPADFSATTWPHELIDGSIGFLTRVKNPMEPSMTSCGQAAGEKSPRASRREVGRWWGAERGELHRPDDFSATAWPHELIDGSIRFLTRVKNPMEPSTSSCGQAAGEKSPRASRRAGAARAAARADARADARAVARVAAREPIGAKHGAGRRCQLPRSARMPWGECRLRRRRARLERGRF